MRGATWDELTNRSDVVESAGAGPAETTAGTTTVREAWEALCSDESIPLAPFFRYLRPACSGSCYGGRSTMS